MFNLAEYQTCAERLELFWKDHPDGRIDTKLIEASTSRFIVQAFIYRTEVDQYPWASGLAEETISGRGVNATSALENCETSSLARALANAGYSPKGDPSKRASREEMSKVQEQSKVKAELDKVKAKMAQTSSEYIPVEKAHDPWTTAPAQQAQTLESAVEMVKDILGGTTDSDIQTCVHGEMVWKTGTGKTGKQWGHWRCIGKILGEAERCEPRWYEITADGTWKPQVQRG
jgi:signal recognition particle subunit SEC65